MRGICRGLAGLSLLLPFMANTAMAQVCGTNGTLNNLEVVGLTDSQPQQLVCFREATPQTTRAIGAVTGLNQNETIVGIDFRPSNGTLVGLTNQARLVVLNQQNGAATLLSSLNVGGQPQQLQGNSFGVDFNPTSGALRITSNTGQNLRVNPVDTGVTIVDGVLNVPGAPAGTPAPQGVTAAAYSNNDASPTTATILYLGDNQLNQLNFTSAPNQGIVGIVGNFGSDTAVDASFDIFTRIATGNTPQLVRGLYVSSATGQPSVLSQVDLNTGLLSQPRNFANGTRVVGLAIPLVQGTINATTPN